MAIDCNPIGRRGAALAVWALVAAPGFLAGCTTLTGAPSSSSFAQTSRAGGPVGVLNGLAARPSSGLQGKTLQDMALAAEYRALEYKNQGETVTWESANGISGRVVAFQPYRVGQQDCRQFTHTFTIDGEMTTLRGAACRTDNGSWTVI